MKPRLLFISRKWPPAIGGMETYSVELAAALDGTFEITELVLPGRSNGRPPTLFGYSAFLVKAMLFCLARGSAFSHVVFGDLILFPAALCCRLVRRNQYRVVVVYGLDLVYGQRRGLLPRCYRAYFALFVACQNLFTRIVAISRHTADVALEAGLKTVAVVTPSLPDTALTNAPETATELPVEFRTARRRILQFGRVVPRKGALWFAQRIMPALPEDIEFFVAGSALGYRQLEELRASPRTHYLGPMPTDKLAALIRQSDIVVMPNIPSPTGSQDIEGFGLVAIETSSLGGILLAARFQGLEDAVVEGSTGNLVAPGNTDEWLRAVSMLINESSQQQSDRRKMASQQTRIHYSRDRMGNDFIKCFEPNT